VIGMIEFLSDWLKKIILLILLATFIDLLLPNSSMQRYVKLVIGLFVLMTILSPIFQLLHSDWKPAERFWLTEKLQAETEKMKSMQKIQADADSIRTHQQEILKQTVQTQLEQQIREQVESEHGSAVKGVGVELAERNEQWIITSMTLQLSRGSPETLEKDRIHPIQPMEPIEPVTVNINEHKTVSSLPMMKSQNEEADSEVEEIRNTLSRTWNVSKQQIKITFEEKQGG
jgi:stage III sporulation protein AF